MVREEMKQSTALAWLFEVLKARKFGFAGSVRFELEFARSSRSIRWDQHRTGAFIRDVVWTLEFLLQCRREQDALGKFTKLHTAIQLCQSSERLARVDRQRFCVQNVDDVTTETISSDSPMSAVLETFPGAQRALFRRYHIGGCSSCGFQPAETLTQVCARNGNLDVNEVMAHIRSSHEQDARILIEPKELAEWRKQDPTVRLVDVRSREEFEAVRIEGSVLLSQDVMRQIMGEGTNTKPLVIVDHQGRSSLDAAAYFMGHGLQNVRCLRGGIDAWAQEVEPAIRRYELG